MSPHFLPVPSLSPPHYFSALGLRSGHQALRSVSGQLNWVSALIPGPAMMWSEWGWGVHPFRQLHLERWQLTTQGSLHPDCQQVGTRASWGAESRLLQPSFYLIVSHQARRTISCMLDSRRGVPRLAWPSHSPGWWSICTDLIHPSQGHRSLP